MKRAAKRAALKKGQMSERIALLALMLKFYKIEARNYRTQEGEIDLIIRRGRVIAFVEVKARADFAKTEMAIDGYKLARMARAASHWLVRHPWAHDYTLRVDAVDIVPFHWPRHRIDIAPLALGP